MIIQKYIKELLWQHDCVVVPGLGGFVSNYVPAQIFGDGDARIVPPSKKILFNAQLRHDDGLLIGSISESNKIGYPEAKELVKKDVAHLLARLRSAGRASLEGFGLFSVTPSKALVFESGFEENFLSDSFGLYSFHIFALNAQHITHHSAAKDHSPVRNALRKKALRGALFLTPILAILLAVPYFIVNDDANQQYPRINVASASVTSGLEAELMASTDKRNVLRVAPVPVAAKPQVTADSATTKKEVIQEAAIPAQEDSNKDLYAEMEQNDKASSEIKGEPAHEPVHRYSIIVGVFSARSNAQELADELITSGFKAAVFEDGLKFRVCMHTFDSKERAKKELDDLKFVDPDFFKSAWILEL